VRSLPLPSAKAETSLRVVGPLDLYQALLADSRCENTMLSRRFDVSQFAKFVRAADNTAALAMLIANGRGHANALALAFRQWRQRQGKASGTINRSLSSLRRAVRLAERLDLVSWELAVDDVPHVPVRDVRGPSEEVLTKLWAAAVAAGDGPIAVRNRLMIGLLADNALRISECLSVDYPADVDIAGQRVGIRQKGSSSKVWVTVGPRCLNLLRAWLATRGQRPGPLLVSRPCVGHTVIESLIGRAAELRESGKTALSIAALFNSEGLRTPKGHRWTPGSVWQHLYPTRTLPSNRLPIREANRIFHDLCNTAGIDIVHPHGLRHYSISKALDLMNGNVRKVMKFARHKKPDTTLRYDDARQDFAGEIAKLLGAEE
jgi:integrase/recombinase XerC